MPPKSVFVTSVKNKLKNIRKKNVQTTEKKTRTGSKIFNGKDFAKPKNK